MTQTCNGQGKLNLHSLFQSGALNRPLLNNPERLNTLEVILLNSLQIFLSAAKCRYHFSFCLNCLSSVNAALSERVDCFQLNNILIQNN